ncbi:hypothetical protein GGR74_002447 [Xanthomonas arboricola]
MLRDGDTGQRSDRGQLDDPLAAPGWQQLRAATADGAWGAVVASTLQRCALFVIELASARAAAAAGSGVAQVSLRPLAGPAGGRHRSR